ncbi:MAG: hypothetical protein E4H38_05495, partial [Gemmatimonadales bacterium]
MRRSSLFFGILLLGAASVANAQNLTMQMSNGWSFSFSGNVNIFAMYQDISGGGDGLSGGPVLTPDVDSKGLYYGTGLLPAFATFAATGKEGNTDLGVHFGFAPQVQCGGNSHDCFGAQIDMRQVFMTIGGSWGSITAGKELGVYQRQNILNDQTLFGVGGGGIAPGGTTLGRIGYGYIYPNFVPQFTYTTVAGKPMSLSIGLMEPSAFGVYNELTLPRVEAEMSYKSGNILFFVSGTAQTGKDPVADDRQTAYGGAAGITYKANQVSLHASGYAGRGLGTTLMFSDLSYDVNADLTKSYGGFGQITFTPSNSKMTFAGSYGLSSLKFDDVGGGQEARATNSLISGGLYYQATKSLKMVFEGDYMTSSASVDPGTDPDSNNAFTGAFGLM